MQSDQVIKELLKEYFPEAVSLFLPDAARRLDLSTFRFLDKELFTDLPEGEVREADLIVEVKTLAGNEEIILFHIEVQGQRRSVFAYRMFEYFMLIRLRHRRKVFPVVMYLSPGAGGLVWENYTENVLGANLLSFQYAAIGLPDLSAEDYSTGKGVFASVLSVGMKAKGIDKVERKWQALLSVVRSEENEARKSLLATVVETLLPFNEEEETAFRVKLSEASPEGKEVSAMVSPYEIRGREMGRQEGLLEGKQEALISLLRLKFGALPEALEARVLSLPTVEEVDVFLARILTANSLVEMGLSGDA